MNAKVKSILVSKTFWTAIVAAVVGIVYMILDGQASKEGIVAEVMSTVMVVLRLVTTEPVKVRAPKRATGILIAVLLGGLVAGGAGMYACSAAQVRQMRIAGSDAMACLTQCGASEAVTTLHDYGDDGSVRLTWKDATKDMIDCATPCLWGLGVATFSTYAIGLPYCGSASERSVYGGTMTEIVVSPRKQPSVN